MEELAVKSEQHRADDLTVRAAQIRALPPAVQNREATLLVRCPSRSLVLRVFRLGSGVVLALPVSQGWIARIVGSDYWFVVPQGPQVNNVMAARCRCCARLHPVSAEEITAAVRAGARTITLCAVS